MKIKLLIFFCLLSVAACCQNENSVWCFGDSAGIDFSSGSAIPFGSGMDGRGSCVSVSDSSGNLIMYSFTQALGISDWATQVYNSSHYAIFGADSITGEGLFNEVAIIPKPGSVNLFYLFSI